MLHFLYANFAIFISAALESMQYILNTWKNEVLLRLLIFYHTFNLFPIPYIFLLPNKVCKFCVSSTSVRWLPINQSAHCKQFYLQKYYSESHTHMCSLYEVYFELALRCRYAPSAPTDIYIYNCNVVHTYSTSQLVCLHHSHPPLPLPFTAYAYTFAFIELQPWHFDAASSCLPALAFSCSCSNWLAMYI